MTTPAREQIVEIAAKQDEKAKAIEAARSEGQRAEELEAARMIQRNYRGYRTRRAMQGMRLDASTRWVEAIREIQFRNATRPRSPDHRLSISSSASTVARQNWKRIGEIARRAGHDDPSDDEDEYEMAPEEYEAFHRKRREARLEREKIAKAMDLQYFLEMVDSKHRYGSNLRAYHQEWMKSDTHENFFYWLDHGGGKNLELPTVSRARLEAEQVRYLSREERQQYLVKVDDQGRLCWAKNGERITTSTDYKDSIEGIVPIDDPTPAYKHDEPLSPEHVSEESTSTTQSGSKGSQESKHYETHEFDKAKGLAKLKLISPSVILDQLLQKSIRPNSWIFVADTSFRLYVGIKQAGAFQHSSFLNGARIIAAGLIEIKDGKLKKLSPLSGHYRPPTKNFRQFEKSLREAGVDMSHVSISRSYAILLGLEAYVRTRKKIKKGIERLHHGKQKVARPEEYKEMKEAQVDQSKSAETERQVLAVQVAEEEERKRQMSLPARVKEKIPPLPITRDGTLEDFSQDEVMRSVDESTGPQSEPGEDIESAIPPDGKR